MKTIKKLLTTQLLNLYTNPHAVALLCKQHEMKKHTVLQFNSGHLFGLPEIKRHTNTMIH